MPRKAETIVCTAQERKEIERIAKSRTAQFQHAQRAKIILKCLDGMTIKQIAQDMNVRPNTVIDRRNQFKTSRVDALYDRPRSGKPPIYTEDFRKLVLDTLQDDPPEGYTKWDGPLLARHLDTSVDAVWRLLRKEGICLARKRSWCVSTDPEFAAKAADIVGLYLAPPKNAIVLAVDEKPSIQALSRTTGFVYTRNGKIARAYKSTYKRNGTMNLFAALTIATGNLYGKVTKQKKRVDFLKFMDELLLGLSQDKQYHVILDNYCIHKRCDEWLNKHPNVKFHFTPTSASWLNMVEIWFGIFSRKILSGSSFSSTDELRQAIERYIKAYNANDAHPFTWRKRQVKGAQIKNNIYNLCR